MHSFCSCQPVDSTCRFAVNSLLFSFQGIDPSVNKMQKEYLDQFCKDFEKKLKDMITESIAEHKVAETDNLLYTEVVQHTLFCKRRLRVVYGRRSTLKVNGYVAPLLLLTDAKLVAASLFISLQSDIVARA